MIGSPWKSIRCLGLIIGAAAFPGSAVRGQSFVLGFEAPVKCSRTDPTTVHLDLSLTQIGAGPGAEGWSIALRAAGHRLVGITVEDTAAEPALASGFVWNELTAGEGNEGAVSVVVLALGRRQALALGRQVIAHVDVEAQPGEEVRLEFADRLRSAAGVVTNAVQVGSGAILPTLLQGKFTAKTVNTYLGFAAENVYSAALFDGVIGGEEATGEVEVLSSEESTASVHVFPTIVTDIEGSTNGILAWSLAVALEGEAEAKSVTTAGTAVDQHFSGGFNKTSIRPRLWTRSGTTAGAAS